MVEQIIKQYNKHKMSIIQKLSESVYFDDEIPFQDDGKIYGEIEILKVEHQNTMREIEFLRKYDSNDSERTDKIRFLTKKCDAITEKMAFLASNSGKNIEGCLRLIEGRNILLEPCLKALICYQHGNIELAYHMLSDFIRRNGDFSKHFLLNKVYGDLLIQYRQHNEAKKYLLRAIRLRPENIEAHKALYNVYVACNNMNAAQIEKNIIALLEG